MLSTGPSFRWHSETVQLAQGHIGGSEMQPHFTTDIIAIMKLGKNNPHPKRDKKHILFFKKKEYVQNSTIHAPEVGFLIRIE